MVTAKDGSGQANDTASIVVTIMVVDEDEKPAITEAGLAVSGRKEVGYNENKTASVQIYSALGPDAGNASWSVSGADGSHFSIKSNGGGGELNFKNPPDFEIPGDQDTNNVYMVTVVANDGANTAMMDVAVTVANVDEPGVITLNPAHPGVGSVITATLGDPDGDTSDLTWGWHRSTNKEIGWNSIPGATSDTYTPVEADGNHYLRAVATYTDPEGTGKRAGQATAGAVGAITEPTFPAGADTRSVAENTPAGGNIGARVVASDDGALTYTLRGADAASFDIATATGQLQVKSALDYETKSSYTVTVVATDADRASDEITVTIEVTNVDEDGAVTLSSANPRVGTALTASLTDPDGVTAGSVTWQWASSADGSTDWAPIAGVSSGTYTPVAADVGNYLRAMPSYTDRQGSGKSAPPAVSANPVAAATTGPTTGSEVADRYDENKDGEIDGDEVLDAVDAYFADQLTPDEILDIVDLYFAS